MRISDWSSDVCSSDLVLRKALEANLPVVLVVNKVDRADARIAEVVHEVEELFLDLDADENQIDFPIVYAVSREGKASLERPADGAGLPDGDTLRAEEGRVGLEGVRTVRFGGAPDHKKKK